LFTGAESVVKMLLEVFAISSLIISAFSKSSAPKHTYVEYRQGDINIIISVPHDGQKEYTTSKIPERKPGCRDKAGDCQYGKKNKIKNCKEADVCNVTIAADMHSYKIAKAVYDKFEEGKKPSFIRSKLHRKRLDPNREIEAAAQGNAAAIKVYNAYHDSIKHAIENFDGKPGFLLDFHGYKDEFSQNNTLLGYLIRPKNLDKGKYTKEDVSVKALVERTNLSVDDLLFGEDTSFGAMFEDSGYHALPSPRQHSPNGDRYFNGGYITLTYGSRDKGNVDAIQLEFQSWIRSYASEDEQNTFCDELAKNIKKFYQLYYEPKNDKYGTYSNVLNG